MLFRGLVGLLQTLWPFIKESVFQDGTFRDWLRRHRTSCVWLTFQFIMFLTVLWMADSLKLERQAHAKLQRDHDILKTHHQDLQERYTEVKVERDTERARGDDLSSQLAAGGLTPGSYPSGPSEGAQCEYFQPPNNPSLPAFRPLSAREMRNKDAVVSTLIDQNAELRQYLLNIDRNWVDAYTRYVASCGLPAGVDFSQSSPKP